MKLATLALALLSLFTTADVASAQAVECGKCQNSLQDISTVTTGGRTAGWVTISQKKGTCKARPGGPCSETEGCRGEFRIDIEGGQGGNSFYYTYKV